MKVAMKMWGKTTVLMVSRSAGTCKIGVKDWKQNKWKST